MQQNLIRVEMALPLSDEMKATKMVGMRDGIGSYIIALLEYGRYIHSTIGLLKAPATR